MSEDTQKFVCPKCGFSMKSTDRFCIHCGYINYDNQNNKFMKKYDKNAKRLKKKEINNDEIEDTSQLSLTDYNMKKVSSTEDVDKVTGKIIKTSHKIVRIITVLFIFIVILFGYSYIKDKQDIYIEDANKIIDAVKKDFEGNSNCKRNGTFYYSFKDNILKYRFNLDIKSNYKDSSYRGYVKVVKSGNSVKYYISLNDGTFGIRENESSKLSPLKVLPYNDYYPSIKDITC